MYGNIKDSVRRNATIIVKPTDGIIDTDHVASKAAGSHILTKIKQESLALASMARDDSPASSTAAAAARRPMRGKVGLEFANLN